MLLICWVTTLYQAPRLFIKRLTSNSAYRLSDSTSVRNLPGAREKNLNVMLLKPKEILLKYASINTCGEAGFRLARGSKHPAAHPHLSGPHPYWLLALCSWRLQQPSLTAYHSHGQWRKAPKAQANTQCLSLGHRLILKPAMTWWWPDVRYKTHHRHRDWEQSRHAPERKWRERRTPAQASTRPPHEVFPGLSPEQSCYHTLRACHSILKAPGAPRCCWVFHNLVPPFAFSAGSLCHTPNHCQDPMPDVTDYSLKIHWPTRVYACDHTPSFHFFLPHLTTGALIFNLTSPRTNFSLHRTSFDQLYWSQRVQAWKDENPVWNRLIIQGV